MVGLSSLRQEAFIDYDELPNYVKWYSPPAQSRAHPDSQERLAVKSAKTHRKVEQRIERISSEQADVALGPSLCESSFSNLNQFLEFTTPSVPLQYLPKTCLWNQCSTRWKPLEADSIPFFNLGDLWNSFDEWSAYGAGVPLLLKGEESVVQYYVPYLSALQLYTRADVRCHLNSRKLGEESDVSDSDLRDTSSEASSDGEIDGVLNLEPGKKCKNHGERLANPNCCVAENSFSLSGCWPRNGSHGKVEAVIDEEEIWEDQERPGHLGFEYFERAAPYSRVPLVDKISELSHDFPQLRTLQSVELLPESWLSVAWYPIYRIPTGPTLRDLATCFLTYHSLSTSFKGVKHATGCLRLQDKQLFSSRVLVDNKLERALLQSFGLASYKLRGAFWTSVGSSERRMALDLQDCAEFWLKQRCVQHPDFEFFFLHSVTGRH